MSQSQTAPRTTTHRTDVHRAALTGGLLAVATAVLVGLGAGTAAARSDAGEPLPSVGHRGACFLERVDSQLVRCDDLTGNGVSAPAYVPER